ncbi:thioredoxin [bacterium]|nr:thioredoxin [bacterium]
MSVTVINSQTFDTEVLIPSKESPVLIDFWAPWCGPCKMISPLVEELSDEYGQKVKFVKMNTDESPETAMKYGIMSIPTLMIFRDGEPVDRIIGYTQKNNLKRKIDELL